MGRLTNQDKKIIDLLKENIHNIMEMTLKQESVRFKKQESFRPFFSSLTLREISSPGIMASDGAVMLVESDKKNRFARGELRIGSYDRGGSVDREVFAFVPDDYNSLALTRKIWFGMNEGMYEAVRDLNEKNTNSIGIPKKFHSFIHFSKEEAETYYSPPKTPKIDFKFWSRVLSRVSGLFISEEVINSYVVMSCCFEKRYFVNSEGACIVDGTHRINFTFKLSMRCEDNIVLGNSESLWFLDFNELPSEKELLQIAKNLTKELKDIMEAPVEKTGTYPVIVDGHNHGVIWHEAIGHSLEGGRQEENDDDDSEEENVSLTFKDKTGEQIAPKFITVFDDPTVPGYDGSYQYDEEGVRPQRVLLVENGVLRNYLHSRETAGKLGAKTGKTFNSNGHARVDATSLFEDPTPRMSNLFVRSEKKHSMSELKEMLFSECRKRGLKYGLLLESSLGGFVDFEGGYFHVFPKNVFRLYLNGRVERVRGVFIVSTPYQLLENIVATSDNIGVFRGECGAESGWVSTTASAPDAFIRSVEFGVIPRAAYPKCYPFLSKPPVK